MIEFLIAVIVAGLVFPKVSSCQKEQCSVLLDKKEKYERNNNANPVP